MACRQSARAASAQKQLEARIHVVFIGADAPGDRPHPDVKSRRSAPTMVGVPSSVHPVPGARTRPLRRHRAAHHVQRQDPPRHRHPRRPALRRLHHHRRRPARRRRHPAGRAGRRRRRHQRRPARDLRHRGRARQRGARHQRRRRAPGVDRRHRHRHRLPHDVRRRGAAPSCRTSCTSTPATASSRWARTRPPPCSRA